MKNIVNFSGYQSYIDKIIKDNNNIAISSTRVYEIFWYALYNCVLIPKYNKVMIYFNNNHELLNTSHFTKRYFEENNINFSFKDGNVVEYYFPENKTYLYYSVVCDDRERDLSLLFGVLKNLKLMELKNIASRSKITIVTFEMVFYSPIWSQIGFNYVEHNEKFINQINRRQKLKIVFNE